MFSKGVFCKRLCSRSLNLWPFFDKLTLRLKRLDGRNHGLCLGVHRRLAECGLADHRLLGQVVNGYSRHRVHRRFFLLELHQVAMLLPTRVLRHGWLHPRHPSLRRLHLSSASYANFFLKMGLQLSRFYFFMFVNVRLNNWLNRVSPYKLWLFKHRETFLRRNIAPAILILFNKSSLLNYLLLVFKVVDFLLTLPKLKISGFCDREEFFLYDRCSLGHNRVHELDRKEDKLALAEIVPRIVLNESLQVVLDVEQPALERIRKKPVLLVIVES